MEDKIGGDLWGRREVHAEILVEESKERNHFESAGVEASIIHKTALKESGNRCME
jgi:hypothetical protein